MDELRTAWQAIVDDREFRSAAWAVVIVLGGIIAARLAERRLPLRRLHPQHQLVIRRGAKYLILILSVVWGLRLLGVDLGVLLGAAGLFTVAIGFAAQTSASNLISGWFLMAERPFVLGDLIRVAEVTGEVVAIDSLSVRLRTMDNLIVRIPNETMLKSNVTNVTAHPIRRFDLQLGVAYKEDLSRVRQVLMDVAHRIPICLEEPKAQIIYQGFGDSAVNLQFSVWATRENFLELRNTIYEAVKAAFDEHGIEIPFPHRTLYAGSASEPIVVRVEDPRPRDNPS